MAGDLSLGREYLDAVSPLVWQAASREHFVEDVQAMRRRVEEHVPAAESARQLKLGPGGLRDVEFSVQLLQLVHGRTDRSLRSGTTLEALAALSRGGYVAREDAAVLDESYRLLRTLEHRIQLFRLRRTHLMPSGEADLRRLGRAVGHRSDPASAVVEQWQQQAREVRRLHERRFYRPLLIAGPPGTRARLDALMEAVFPKSTGSKWKFAWEVLEIPVGVETDLLGHSVLTAEVIHQSGAPSTALRLNDGVKIFAYSGDTEWTDALLPIARDADLFVCECYAYSGRLTGHMVWEILKARVGDLRARQLMVTHMGPGMLAHVDEAKAAGVLIAKDGLVLEI